MPSDAPNTSAVSWEKVRAYKPDRRKFGGRSYTKVGQLNEQTSRAGASVWAHIRPNASAAYTPSLVDSDGGEIKAARVYTGNEPESIRARPWDILTPVVPFDLLPTNSKEAAAAFFRVMYIVQEEPDARPVQLIDILRRVIDYDRPYPRLRRDPKLKLRMTKRRRLSNESSTGIVDSFPLINTHIMNDGRAAAGQSNPSPTLASPMQPVVVPQTEQLLPSPTIPSPIIMPHQLPDHFPRRSHDASDRRLGYTAEGACVQDLASLDSFSNLCRFQRQLEARQELENQRISRLLKDVAAIDEKIGELERTHGSDLELFFAHIRHTCLAKCIKMVTTIQSSPTGTAQVVRSLSAAAQDRTGEAVHIPLMRETTIGAQAKQRQHQAEPINKISSLPNRFLVGVSSEGIASTFHRNDLIEDGSSSVVAMDEENTMQDDSRTSRGKPAFAIDEDEDAGESDYSNQ
ncbi:hypothetical protein PTNB73_10516 [Pyrenophora teres f. teres]|nr:hypothetical protein PTNB73_10516 [Pyrenophora teres f. teres]